MMQWREKCTTEMLIEEIKVVKLKQPAVAEIIAMVIMNGNHHEVDWVKVNSAIVERWSPSARERVLEMAWTIVDKAEAAQS